jgi:hypothetical protein
VPKVSEVLLAELLDLGFLDLEDCWDDDDLAVDESVLVEPLSGAGADDDVKDDSEAVDLADDEDEVAFEDGEAETGFPKASISSLGLNPELRASSSESWPC